MKIIITGATGSIGQYLVAHFLEVEYSLTLIVRNLDKSKELFPNNSRLTYIKWRRINKDIFNTLQPEGVIHLASYSTASDSEEIIDHLIDSNIKLGVKLLHYLEGVNSLKFFINVGSSTEYHNGSLIENPTYLYSASKTAFKSFLYYYAQKLNIKAIHIVLYSVYGIVSKKKRIMDYLLGGLDSTIPIKVSAGNQKIDFIHIEDVIDFFSTVIRNIHMVSTKEVTLLHAGNGETITIKQIARLIEDYYEKKLNLDWGALPYRLRDNMYSKALLNQNIIVWHPSLSLEQGLFKYLESLT